MMLGDILAAARHSESVIERCLAETEPALAARLAEAAAAEGEMTRSFVRIAVADFGRFAGEDDWATLVSRLRDNADPGMTCLIAILEWRIAAMASHPGIRPAFAEG